MKFEIKHLTSGSGMMAALVASNFLNFLFNSILGRKLSFEDFALVTLVITFYYLSGIFTTALAGTINFKTSQLHTQKKEASVKAFFSRTLKQSTLIAIVVMVVWLLATPALASFLHVSQKSVFLAFAPVLVLSTITYDIIGYFQGNLFFNWAGIVTVAEPVTKLMAGLAFLALGIGAFSYFAIPLSLLFSSIVGIAILLTTQHFIKNAPAEIPFPKKFFGVALLGGISSTLFFSIDIIMVKHFFSAELTGQYALLSLIGKMVFFFATILNIYTLPITVRTKEEEKRKQLYLLLAGGTALLGVIGWLGLGVAGDFFIPLLFGNKAAAILPLIPTYTFAIALFAVSAVTVSFHMACEEFIFVLAPLLAAIGFSILIYFHHQDLAAVTANILWTCIALFVALIAGHLYYPKLRLAYEK